MLVPFWLYEILTALKTITHENQVVVSRNCVYSQKDYEIIKRNEVTESYMQSRNLYARKVRPTQLPTAQKEMPGAISYCQAPGKEAWVQAEL